MTVNVCPKCRYQRQTIDHNIHPDICPSCGIVYSKFIAKHSPENPVHDSEPEAETFIEREEVITLRQQY
jgi:hypothetical protein